MRDNFIAFPSGIKPKHGFRVIRGFKTAFRITSVADRTDFEALHLYKEVVLGCNIMPY